jgi:hypothetical protein
MNSVTKHIGYLGLLVAFTLSNVGASHAGDLTFYDADGDGLIDYLDDNGNLWPNQQAWEASNAFVTAIEVAEPELPSRVEPAVDSDGDDLTDEEETTLGTDPLVADTDGGGLNDYEETHDDDWRATDPLNPADDMPSSPTTPTDESSAENQADQDDTAENTDASMEDTSWPTWNEVFAVGGAILAIATYVCASPALATGALFFCLIGFGIWLCDTFGSGPDIGDRPIVPDNPPDDPQPPDYSDPNPLP